MTLAALPPLHVPGDVTKQPKNCAADCLEPVAGCLVTTSYPVTFQGGGCPICGQATPAYACTSGFNPAVTTFTDTSPGTFVSLSATLTADQADTYELSINNVVQGSFNAPIGSDGCYTALTDCSVVDLIPVEPQTGYVVGGPNTFDLTSPTVGCYSGLVFTVTTSVC